MIPSVPEGGKILPQYKIKIKRYKTGDEHRYRPLVLESTNIQSKHKLQFICLFDLI